jgi:hypothetical protein
VSPLLAVHAAATWLMVGLIWTIQVVHYPLFRNVAPVDFPEYHRGHSRRMVLLLAVPAILEIGTATALVWERPDSLGLAPTLLAGSLLAGIWIMTALLQAPLHQRLAAGYDPALIDKLVASNWWRTAAWSGRGLLAIWMLVA